MRCIGHLPLFGRVVISDLRGRESVWRAPLIRFVDRIPLINDTKTVSVAFLLCVFVIAGGVKNGKTTNCFSWRLIESSQKQSWNETEQHELEDQLKIWSEKCDRFHHWRRRAILSSSQRIVINEGENYSCNATIDERCKQKQCIRTRCAFTIHEKGKKNTTKGERDKRRNHDRE